MKPKNNGLTHMESDVGIEVVATIRANIFHFTQRYGKSKQTDIDTKTVLDYEDKILDEYETMHFEEIKAFEKKWLSKYPNS